MTENHAVEPISLQFALPSVTPIIAQVRLIYIFAGGHRKSDVGDILEQMNVKGLIKLHILEVDLLRSPEHDVTAVEFWNSLVKRVLDREFNIVIATPPCNTHSRARNANKSGPPPIRSKEFPFGFPWLSGSYLASAQQANRFIEQTFEICRAGHSVQAAFLIEHPEDLGRTIDGSSPASIFALQDMLDLCTETKANTVCFHQCPWGAPSSKPTRVVSTLDLVDPSNGNKLFQGLPSFDRSGYYKGPLPRQCGHRRHVPLIRLENSSSAANFRTAAAAAYPAGMCKWIADMIVRFCCKPKGGVVPATKPDVFPPLPRLPSLPAVAKSSEDTADPPKVVDSLLEASSDEEEPGFKKPLLADHLGGFGPPMQAAWSGKSRPMHDGCGLCSPGRWLPKNRKRCSWKSVDSVCVALRKLLAVHLDSSARVCMKLACGRFDCSPFSDSLLQEGRRILAIAVSKDSALEIDELLEVQIHQPFLLKLIGEILRLMGDPDWRVYATAPKENFWNGVSVGPGTIMPRTPSVYERKIKHRKYDESEFMADVSNYKSAAGPEMSKVLETQFQEESLLGFMYKARLVDVQAEFSDVRVAAQGAIEKSDHSWRILHDATHNVRLNNETVMRDQVRLPSAGDQRIVMQESAAFDEGPHFSLQFDVSKAHRRFLHKKADHGLLCCRADNVEEFVWVNRVGTFGCTAASYWWGRLAAGIGRLVLRCFYRNWLIQLLFADDVRVQANGKTKFDDLLLTVFLWCLLGTPLSWGKCKGGLSCEWVGYWCDYGRFQLGISESRASWLVSWGDRVVREGLVQMRDFAEGLGRLGFSCGVLEFYRPFLAPMYSWCAASPPGSVLKVPPMVRLTLSWVVEQLRTGRRFSLCKKPSRDLGVLFKTDAKGESDYVVLGGWKCAGGVGTKQSHWFSVKLTAEEAPWIFEKGHASRTIASTELLATLIAVHLFVPLPETCPDPSTGIVCCQGLSDNQTNSYVVAKCMTTSFPLAAILMQLTCMLSCRNLWLGLTWVPRLENQEADSLTNGDFSLFSEELRVPVVWSDLPLDVMSSLLVEGKGFLDELDRLKLAKADEVKSSRRKRRRIKNPW